MRKTLFIVAIVSVLSAILLAEIALLIGRM